MSMLRDYIIIILGRAALTVAFGTCALFDPLPPAACGNSPTVNPPDNVQNCTDEDSFNKYYTENLCIPEKHQAYSDVFNRLGARVCVNYVPPSYTLQIYVR